MDDGSYWYTSDIEQMVDTNRRARTELAPAGNEVLSGSFPKLVLTIGALSRRTV
jgi:hypothetical protein